MAKKTISNTFTVNTVEDGKDGATQQQIFYRNQNNQAPATPATSQSDAVPSGWSATPQGVSDVYKYEWVSMRTKTNGVWGAYSQPAVFAYHAEDGTSIRISGGAIEFVQGTWPDVLEPYEADLTTTNIGDIILFDETEDRTDSARIIKRVQPYIEDDKEWNFTTEVVPVGEGYLIVSKDGQASDEGHLYVAKDWSDESDYFYWQDCGRIKGEKGDDGKDITIAGRAVTTNVLTPAYPQQVHEEGAVVLLINNINDISVLTDGTWETQDVEEGVCYICDKDRHLYEKKSDGWHDMGQFQGDDAVVYELVPDVNVINANADGTITTGDIVLHAYRVIGSERSSDVLYYFAENQDEHAQFAIDNGSWTDCSSRGIPMRQTAETYIPAESVQTATSRIRLRLLDGNNAVCGVCPDITIVRNGAQGKIGRFFYFGGEFNSEDESQTFIVNDAQAPYFEHTENGQKRYHVFNYDTNGTYTMAQMWAIRNNWNSKPWEVMTNDFKYIITQALFTDFAKLGSWTFNSDYMYSDLGLNHSTQQESAQGNLRYDGIGDSDNTWTPNVSIDAANGRASFSRDKVRFNPDGSGWLANKNIQWGANGNANFNGTITAMMYYAFPFYLPDGQYTIDLINEPHLLFISDASYSDVVLPSASTYDGIELQFVWVEGTRAHLGYLKFVNSIFVREKDEFGNYHIIQKTNAYIETLSVVKLKSLLGNWYMVSGELTDKFTPT